MKKIQTFYKGEKSPLVTNEQFCYFTTEYASNKIIRLNYLSHR